MIQALKHSPRRSRRKQVVDATHGQEKEETEREQPERSYSAEAAPAPAEEKHCQYPEHRRAHQMTECADRIVEARDGIDVQLLHHRLF